MKNTFSRKFMVCALAGVLGVAFTGCGDDGSSSPKGTGLPAEVADKAELETYECGMDVIGEKVYVTELEENYECDGEKWFKSYDQTKPSSTKSSGSKDTDGSSDSKTADKEGSSDNDKGEATSSSSAKSSSSSIAVDYNALCGATPYDSTTHFCDIRDSAVYAMVRIGSQVWMKENLNHEYGFDGHKYGSYCYHDSAMYCAKYGKLYTWAAAMDSVNTGCGDGAYCDADTGRVQGVCPDGWHLPDTVEWRSLFAAVGGKSVAGTALKSATGWKEGNDPFPGTPFPATNSSGFSALPSGFRYEFTMYDLEGLYAIFWSTSEHDGPRSAHDGRQAFSMAVSSNFPDAGLTYRNKILGLAVRCVKNQ